jgi:sec-independent protein translocase protein TatB
LDEQIMFGIGLPEMIVILIVALLVVGPDKLPDLARSLAKGVNELRNVMHQVKEGLEEESKEIRSIRQDVEATAGQMKENFLEELGAPRQEHLSAMNSDSLNARPWEREDKEDTEYLAEQEKDPEESELEATEDEALAASPPEVTEERTIGKNPSPDASDPS